MLQTMPKSGKSYQTVLQTLTGVYILFLVANLRLSFKGDPSEKKLTVFLLKILLNDCRIRGLPFAEILTIS